MTNELDNEMMQCATTLRAATGNRTDVTVSRRVVFSEYCGGKPAPDFLIHFGDIMNRGEWRWETVNAPTLQEAFDSALKKIMEQGDERARERARLELSAAKFGLKLVEAAQ